MSNPDAARAAMAVARAATIPQSIALHPKLNQAAKFLWVHLWQKAGFHANSVSTTPAAIASQIGGSDRAATRWIESLADSGLIEFVARPRRGGWVVYVNEPPTHEFVVVDVSGPAGSQNTLPGHEPTGDFAPKTPQANEQPVINAAKSPEVSEGEILSLESAVRESKDAYLLMKMIEERREVTGIKPTGENAAGIENANCKQSIVNINNTTIDSKQFAQSVPLQEKKSESIAPDPSPHPLNHPARPDVREAVDSLVKKADGAGMWNTICRAIRAQFPDEREVHASLIRRVATAVVSGKLEAGDLRELLERCKEPDVRKPPNYFVCTIIKQIGKVKPAENV